MAIVQISRIQHRRGVKTLLPQLAASELGGAVYTQELYIGNGSLADGAPELGNTKILTEDDDILALASSYVYKGNTSSPVVTGVDANSPSTRTLRAKLDDIVSVKDFGALGDGNTDDTAAINRAIANLLTVEATGKERRRLLFPGGTYKVTDVIKVYPYTQIVGEGMDSTFIKQTSVSADCLFRTVDRSGNTSANIGTDGAAKPQGIIFDGVHFQTDQEKDLVILDQCEDVHFKSCAFTGTYSTSEGDSSSPAVTSLVTLNSTTALPTRRITFSDCSFAKSYYCVNASDDIQDIFFRGSEFKTSYRAFNLAETADGSTLNRITGPTGVVISSCRFNEIDAEAIKIHSAGGNPRGNIVANSQFRDIGQNGDDSSETTAIQFDVGGNFAHHNYFYRSDNVSTVGGNIYHEGPVENSVTLADNTSGATDTGIQFNSHTENHVKVEYIIARGSSRQSGTLHINGTSASMNIDDSRFPSAGVGITFSVVAATGKVQFTSTNTGDDATLKYRIIRFV